MKEMFSFEYAYCLHKEGNNEQALKLLKGNTIRVKHLIAQIVYSSIYYIYIYIYNRITREEDLKRQGRFTRILSHGKKKRKKSRKEKVQNHSKR